MSTRLNPEYASLFERLPTARRRQVLAYARWLREDNDAPSRNGPATAGCAAVSLDADSLGQEMDGLDCRQQGLIEEYVRALAAHPPRGVPGHALLRFAGTISDADLRRMEQIIAEDFGRIDDEGW